MEAKTFKPEEVIINLNDTNYVLKYDLNAFAELEKRYGNIDAAMEALEKGSVTAVKYVLWAGLIHSCAVLDEITGEPVSYKITPYHVGQWVTPHNMSNIGESLTKAITSSLPAPAEAEKNEQTT
jgi:hypothetical protein